MTDEPVFGPEPLDDRHTLVGFSCGLPALDRYLTERALGDQRSEKSRTYVISQAGRVVGYFTVAAAGVEPQRATARAGKGQGAQAIPAILIARLAVDARYQGRGFGEALLVEALARAAHVADTIGARVVLVHAKDDSAVGFYARYGFEPSPTDPLHLMLLMKDVRLSLGMSRG